MYKVYLSASTQQDNKTIDGYTEEQIQQKFCKIIYDKSGYKCFLRLNKPSMEIKDIVSDSNLWGSHYHIASHSNAGGGNSSTDIYYHTKTGKKMAEYFKGLLQQFLPSRKINVISDRVLYTIGLGEMRCQTTGYCMLIENYWHDKNSDVQYWNNNRYNFEIAYRHLVYRLITGVVKFGWK